MKVLGINGSPRIGGNTDLLLDKVLEGAKVKGGEIEKIILNKLKFSPCLECENVKDDGSCIVEDDMQMVYKKIKEIDVLILASPIFFGSLSAQTKMMIDRFQCLWRAKYILKKDTGFKNIKGAFISVEGSNRQDFFDNAKSIVKNIFATINVDYKDELFCPNIDSKLSILKKPDFLKKAFELGMSIVS
ncbi:flavodoxin family protein [Candidatus Omnitrophota bacterium]